MQYVGLKACAESSFPLGVFPLGELTDGSVSSCGPLSQKLSHIALQQRYPAWPYNHVTLGGVAT
jgi:hypothetical protein